MDRYSLIHTKLPREFVLLQGTGCRWGQCVFCDYHTDTSDTPFKVNEPVLRQVTGRYGVLDIINSGSAMELDEETIGLIREVVCEKHIHTLWFEAHYMYRKRLAQFAQQFAPASVKFRCGVETFCPTLRNQWNKGVPASVTAEEVYACSAARRARAVSIYSTIYPRHASTSSTLVSTCSATTPPP